MIFVTGGCGFIGSNFVLNWISTQNEPIIVIDKLTYAGKLENLKEVENHIYFKFIKADINDTATIKKIFKKYQPRVLLNFAAESHVYRSIHDPDLFIETNILGTFNLLKVAKEYWLSIKDEKVRSKFRFFQISTDEVFGSLNENDLAFTEKSAYAPNNPYSATKASADHIVRAFGNTYGLPTLITNCSNNFGPYQFPEKLIPFTILSALNSNPIKVYGDGLHMRDWLYVKDHCDAISYVLRLGTPGETYNIGGNAEKTNLEIVTTICEILNVAKPGPKDYRLLIKHVEDRKGHDRRYAINNEKIQKELGWKITRPFQTSLKETVEWYLENNDWINSVTNDSGYKKWVKLNYGSKVLFS